TTKQDHGCVTIRLCGDANQSHIARVIACFRETLTKGSSNVVIDLADTRVIDGRFLGLLLMVRKRLKGQGAKLKLVGVWPSMRRLFRPNGIDFLLSSPIEAT